MKVTENTAVKSKAGRPLKYPFDKMSVGSSFFVPNVSILLISPAARSYATNHKMSLSCKTEKKGVRVSRLK